MTCAQTHLNRLQGKLNLQQTEQVCSVTVHLLGQPALPIVLAPTVAASSLPSGWGFRVSCCKIAIFARRVCRCCVAALSGGWSCFQAAPPVLTFAPVGTQSSFFRRWWGWGQALLLLRPQPVAEITLVVIRAVTVTWMGFKSGPVASMRFLCDYNKNLTHMVSY